MKDEVKTAVVQMSTNWLDREANCAKMTDYVERICLQSSTDLIVFPELSNTGYIKGRNHDFNVDFIKAAEPIPGPTSIALCKVAEKYHVHIVAGIGQLHPTIPATLYNSALLIGSQGQIIGVHHKMHIPAEEKHYFYPSTTKEVYKTELGCIGLLVCYDSEIPELPRILSLKGAEILIGVYNWGWPEGTYGTGRLSRLAAVRALENKNYFIACGKVGIEEGKIFYGNSTIAAPDGEIIVEALPVHDKKESILHAVLTQDALIRERSLNTTFCNRRPDMYKELIEPF